MVQLLISCSCHSPFLISPFILHRCIDDIKLQHHRESRYTCVDVDRDVELCSESCRVVQLFVGHGPFMLFIGRVSFL
ncbi:hypothetical protein ACSBR2_033391 [Camellia fascicularis]